MRVKILIVFGFLVSFTHWSPADDESPHGTTRTIDSLIELTRELNKESRIDQNGRLLPVRENDPGRIAKGEKLYRENCIQCHGEKARGVPNWHQRDASGNFPPPPLDGTAHTWHHPESQLIEMIRTGSSIMPSFDSELSADEIGDIIHWFQSFWPDDVYQAWTRQNAAFEQTNN